MSSLQINHPEELLEILQAQLEERMFRISAKYWKKSWPLDFEFEIWERMHSDDPKGYSKEDLEELKALAHVAGGWFHWPIIGNKQDKCPSFVPLNLWEGLFSLYVMEKDAKCSSRNRKRKDLPSSQTPPVGE